jgi:hypothetical protein
MGATLRPQSDVATRGSPRRVKSPSVTAAGALRTQGGSETRRHPALMHEDRAVIARAWNMNVNGISRRWLDHAQSLLEDETARARVFRIHNSLNSLVVSTREE